MIKTTSHKVCNHNLQPSFQAKLKITPAARKVLKDNLDSLVRRIKPNVLSQFSSEARFLSTQKEPGNLDKYLKDFKKAIEAATSEIKGTIELRIARKPFGKKTGYAKPLNVEVYFKDKTNSYYSPNPHNFEYPCSAMVTMEEILPNADLDHRVPGHNAVKYMLTQLFTIMRQNGLGSNEKNPFFKLFENPSRQWLKPEVIEKIKASGQ